MNKKLIIFFILLALLSADKIFAADASLFIEPERGTYYVNDVFPLKIKLNSDGITINAAKASISFPKGLASVQSVSKLGSIFQLWPEEPSFSNSNGTISFGGGVPAPGFNGMDTVIVVNFKVKTAGNANINITDGQILAADGRGTDILSSLRGGVYTFIAAKTPQPVKEKPVATTSQVSIIPAPEILVYPKYYVSGEELFYVEGKAVPSSTVMIYLKSGESAYKHWETGSDENGDWVFSGEETMASGQYILSAKIKTADGQFSGFSPGYRVNVSLPGITIGSLVIPYPTFLIILIILIILITLIVLPIFLYKSKKSKNKLKKEIAEAEESLVNTFVELGRQLTKKIEYLDSKPGLNTREKQLRDELFYILKNSEEIISKEIDDIKKELNK